MLLSRGRSDRDSLPCLTAPLGDRRKMMLSGMTAARDGRYVMGGNGGRTWARTKDPLIKSQLLYQLSYASIPGCFGALGECASAVEVGL